MDEIVLTLHDFLIVEAGSVAVFKTVFKHVTSCGGRLWTLAESGDRKAESV